MSILVSPEYTTKVIKQNNTLREITIENYKNRSVNEAINYVINEAKQQLETTDTRIITNKIIELLQSIPQTNTTSKSNTILYPILLKHESVLINFIEQVKTDYEDILSRSHTEFTQDVIQNITNLTNIEFDRECLTDINNPKFTNCETWLSKRCALYNPSVNFEHVMFIVDIMLNGYAQSTEVLLPFYFFLKLWIDERQTMKFLIYHFMKLIRVYILSKYTQTPFTPAQSFTNIRFGAITDQNIEIYGDVRLSDDETEITSLFSLSPRTHIVKAPNENIICFDWNILNMFVKSFTKKSKYVETIFLDIHELQRFGNHYELFKMLNTEDVIPRFNYIKSNKMNDYKTLFIDDEKPNDDIPIALFNELCNFIINGKYTIDEDTLNTYGEHLIYITYTGTNGVKTISTNKTLLQLIETIYNQKDENGMFTPIVPTIETTLRDYIPIVKGNFSRANRNIITPNDNNWDNLYSIIHE